MGKKTSYVFSLNTKRCHLAEQEDMSSWWKRGNVLLFRHALLFNKKKKHVSVSNKKTCFLVQHEEDKYDCSTKDMYSCRKKKPVCVFKQHMYYCSTRRQVFWIKLALAPGYWDDPGCQRDNLSDPNWPWFWLRTRFWLNYSMLEIKDGLSNFLVFIEQSKK